ncbi:MAG: tail fiber domain-containing protein [Nitrospirae bacterium]|nr:tail fiber domain-containing protein [Nitrospirota bacterium]
MKSISEFIKSFESSSFKSRRKTLYCTILILLFASLTSTAYAEPDAAEQSAYASETVPYTFTSGTTAQSSQVNANFTYLANRSWSLSGSNLYYSGGHVGIGESSPQGLLQVGGTSSGASGQIYFGNASGGTSAIGFIGNNSLTLEDNVYGANMYFVTNRGHWIWYDADGTEFMRLQNWDSGTRGYLGIGTATPSYPLHMGSGAYVTAGGVWTNASSREYKKDIKALSSEDAMMAFNKLEPVSFKYKTDDEQHVGFIAEDVPDLVASGDRKGLSSMDMVAVLTKVVQEQQRAIASLSKQVKSLKAKMKDSKTTALTNKSN